MIDDVLTVLEEMRRDAEIERHTSMSDEDRARASKRDAEAMAMVRNALDDAERWRTMLPHLGYGEFHGHKVINTSSSIAIADWKRKEELQLRGNYAAIKKKT